VSGTANVTSANTSTTSGTIYNYSTSGGVTISGGTVSNTSTGNGNAIYNRTTGTVTISGGIISKAGAGNYAVNNVSTGTVTIDPAATIVGNNYGITP